MLTVKWSGAFLVLGLLVAMQGFAQTLEGTMAGDHMKLSMSYEQ